MAEKEIAAVVKIQIPAGQASPAPPVGTALGPHGIAIMDFCKEYNAKTEDKRGQVVPVEITIYADRTFSSFITKTPPTSFFFGKLLALTKPVRILEEKWLGQLQMLRLRKLLKLKCQI